MSILTKIFGDPNEKVLREIKPLVEEINKLEIEKVYVYSPLTCKSTQGICQKCYGWDLGTNKLIKFGNAVGVVAAQAIGEPGTQLTMRTFHAGGIASTGGDITAGLPRVEEIFEKRKPKNPAVISHLDGMVSEIKVLGHDKLIVITPEVGEVKGKKLDNEYTVSASRASLVKVGQNVLKGDLLTDGSADLDELFRYAGREKTENYIIHEVSKLYELQGAAVSHKHIELIVRQMFSRRKIKDSGDSHFTRGDVVEISELVEMNSHLKTKGLKEVGANAVIMGISELLVRGFIPAYAPCSYTGRYSGRGR